MIAAQLWHEYKELKERCVLAIRRLMQYNDHIILNKSFCLSKEPDVEVTGVRLTDGKILIIARSFGFLENWYLLASDCFLTVKDYISLIEQLELQ